MSHACASRSPPPAAALCLMLISSGCCLMLISSGCCPCRSRPLTRSPRAASGPECTPPCRPLLLTLPSSRIPDAAPEHPPAWRQGPLRVLWPAARATTGVRVARAAVALAAAPGRRYHTRPAETRRGGRPRLPRPRRPEEPRSHGPGPRRPHRDRPWAPGPRSNVIRRVSRAAPHRAASRSVGAGASCPAADYPSRDSDYPSRAGAGARRAASRRLRLGVCGRHRDMALRVW